MSHACDIRDEAMVIGTIDAVLARFGGIYGLVNNAGGQYRTAMKTISTKGFDSVVRNNLTGGFIFMREVYNRWMNEHGGSIVNMIADIWNGWPDFAHSGAARGGMLTLSESAACEWSTSGVRVNTVAPGGIASSGFDTYPPEIIHKLFEYTARVPMQRFGTEAEVSAAIVFLLSPAAAYITGSCIRVDGGAPNARATWNLEPAQRNEPFEGFHRAQIPKVLSQGRK
jgi:citronellol/citronellal dehydrogenase